MPRMLTPQEMVLLQIDTNYLNQGISVGESRVVFWEGMYVLIYHSPTQGYFTTDITDLGQSRIAELAKQSEIHGMWYYLPQSYTDILSESAETAIDAAKSAGGTVTEIAKAAADSIGQTLANLLDPVVGSLMIPLVITGVLLGLYLMRKG